MARRAEFRLDSEYSHRGIDNLNADCRCYGDEYTSALVFPWIALASVENWDNPDDEPRRFDRAYVPIEEFEGEPIPVEHFDADFECYCGRCLQRMADEILGEESSHDEKPLSEVLDDLEESDDPLGEELTEDSFKAVSFGEDYNLNYEYLPKRTSSGVISSKFYSRKDIRACEGKRGFARFSHGNRGNNYYKLLRRGRVRVTNGKSKRISRILHVVQIQEVWVRQRVVCAG